MYSPIPTDPGYDGYAYADDFTANYYDPYTYDTATYDMDAYATSYLDGSASSPYYDTAPLQFSYTPAVIPQRAAVVRPDRASPYSQILPVGTRMPLHHLVVMPRSIPDMTYPAPTSTKYLFESFAD